MSVNKTSDQIFSPQLKSKKKSEMRKTRDSGPANTRSTFDGSSNQNYFSPLQSQQNVSWLKQPTDSFTMNASSYPVPFHRVN
jgi:hypothetical protein